MALPDINEDQKYTSLAFEQRNGEGQNVTALRIDNILSECDAKLELVVLKACNSEKIGNVFAKYAKHVICIRDKYNVRDDIANKFTQKFYGYLC